MASKITARGEDEDQIKADTKATIRCYPLDAPEGECVCFYTGRRRERIAVFARAYRQSL